MTEHMIIIVILVVIFLHYSLTIKTGTLGYKFIASANRDNINIPSYERQALHDLYLSTNGSDWNYLDGDQGHWNFTDPDVNPCSSSDPWQGLNCTMISSDTINYYYYYISEIKLSFYNLRGTIPESIGNFSELCYLNISFNYLYGNLPKTIYELTNLQFFDVENNSFKDVLSYNIYQLYHLQHLDIRRNNFFGTIPATIGNLTKLKFCRISFNDFSGKLPTTIGYLIKLNLLSVSFNHFTGTIPDSIQYLTMLDILSFNLNHLSGTIPPGIGDLRNLTHLSLSNNHLNGTLPETLSNLNSLVSLIVAFNSLSGVIPTWISKLNNLTTLLFDYNHFSGNIPTFICQLSLLKSLGFGSNYLLNGTIPSCLGKLSHILILTLSSNQFSGNIPSSFSDLISLRALDMADNLLTGSITDVFSSLPDLNALLLQDNFFTGTVPISLANLSSLSELFLQKNDLHGKLDQVFNGSLQKSLRNIQLSNNQFTGELPEQLFYSSSLVSVSAVSNCFHGTIPYSICLNKKLKTLALDGLVCASSCQTKILPGISSSYVSSRSITGGIPDCLWSMPKLKILHLSGNSLRGTLPSKIHNLFSLRDLTLSYNSLSGIISRRIQERSWSNLDLSNNRFVGTLSSVFNSTSNNTSLKLDNNRISGSIPSQIQGMKYINILEGNYYTCRYDRKDLPFHDKSIDVYKCGSNILNLFYYIWLGLLIIMITIIIVLWQYREKYVGILQLLNSFRRWVKLFSLLATADESIELNRDGRLKLTTLHYLPRYFAFSKIIRRFTGFCTLFIICILMPTYIILNYFYHTHTYEYAWTVAMIYLTGKVALGIFMSILIIFIIIQIMIYIREFYSENNRIYFTEIDMKRDRQVSVDTSGKSNIGRIWMMYVIYITVNLTIVTGVNILYAIATLYNNDVILIFSQIFLSIFKLMWNNFISPKMVRWIVIQMSIITVAEQSTFFFLQFVVSISNYIIIPCIILLFTSPNCFYDVFHQQSEVESSVDYKECISYDIYGDCLLFVTITSTTSYSPPFDYSYQCSADFITYYAPVFVFVCIISTFIIPLVHLCWIKLNLPNILRFGNLFYPTQDIMKGCKYLIYIDEIYELLVFELTFVGLILTFGTIFPPLAIAFFISICCRSYFYECILGRFIIDTTKLEFYSKLDILEDNFKVQPLQSTLKKCGWFLLYVSCGFYTLFLYDILGDSVGFYKAYWVLIVMPCIPLCIQVLIKCRTWAIDSSIITDDGNQSTEAVQLPSITSLEKTSNPMFTTESDIDRSMPILDIDASDRQGDSIVLDKSPYCIS